MEVKKCEMAEKSNINVKCLHCGKDLARKQRKFCSPEHKNIYNHKVLYDYKYSRAHRAKSPRNYLSQLRSYHNRRETLSLDFLEKLYYDQEGLCAITGLTLTFTQNEGRCPTNVSIDRIDSSLGYTEANVQLVCNRVNVMKLDGTLDELTYWCKAILNG